MGTLHTVSAPPPALSVTGDLAPVANAFFAVTIDSAVDLLAARDYENLTRSQRVAKARAEQQAFLAGFLDPGLHAALDLRVAVEPGAATPLSAALLGRVWGGSTQAASARAEGLRGRLQAALPPHVAASSVEDAGAVARLLAPFPSHTVESAVITRHELIGVPARPDAGVSYYYSAVPFASSYGDWSDVYAALAASPVPLVLSVAVLPMLVPAQFAKTLRTLANFYGRLAADGEAPGGYPGHRLAADPFAVDAERAFADYCRRLSHKAYALRIQLSAPRKLPAGIVEAVAAAIAPACDVRRPDSVAERRLAEYNLNLVNFGLLTGQREIWNRQDPPDPQLAMLPVLGDDRDAGCAFRFPVAADGTVPGFPVSRGRSPRAGTGLTAARAIRLGQMHGTGREVTLPLRSLTGHTLVTGSAGSGKTATAAGLLRQLWAGHQVPFLVIGQARSAGGYRALADEPGFESLEIITAGDESGRPLRFNPFEAPPGALVGEHAASLLACFTAAWGLAGPLPPVYRDALSLTYLRAGFLATERPGPAGGAAVGAAGGAAVGAAGKRSWPTVAHFRDALVEMTGPGYPGRGGASLDTSPDTDFDAAVRTAVRRAGQLARGVTGSAFLTSRPAGIGRLLDHPVILELSPLGTAEEHALMTALLLNAVTGYRRAESARSAGLAHVTLLDEAQLLLARSPGGRWADDAQARERATAALAGALLASGRHGEGVVIVEPAPGRLVSEAVKGTGLKIVHRLTAADDRRCLAEATTMDEAQRVLAARLPAGEALLYGGELPGPLRADVRAAMRPERAAALPGARAGAEHESGPEPVSESDYGDAAVTTAGDAAVTTAGDAAVTTAGKPAASAAGAVGPATPFAACDRCRAQCDYRGAALSILDDPAAVAGISGAAKTAGDGIEDPGLADLRARLYDTVGGFSALPAADPGRGDAAFCLFLHVHASTPLRLRTEWPDLAARMLGITGATDETGTGTGR